MKYRIPTQIVRAPTLDGRDKTPPHASPGTTSRPCTARPAAIRARRRRHVKKVKQLDATIRHLDRDEEKLTGRPRTAERRIYPVVLVAHGFPVNPITMSELHERVARAGLLQGAHLGRLEIIDLDELEQVEALHESGGASLATLLADKQTANLYRTALNQYLYFERRVPLVRPDRQGRLGREVMEGIAARYELLRQNQNPSGTAGA
jgi:hypothetical protein